jgi:hypothetical protein
MCFGRDCDLLGEQTTEDYAREATVNPSTR